MNDTNQTTEQTEVISSEVIVTSVTDKAIVRKLHGQTLDKEYTLDVVYDALADNSAIPAESEFSHAEKVQILNARAKAAARAKSMGELAEKLGIKPPSTSLDSDEKRIAAMLKVFRSMGNDDATSLQLAKAALNIS